MTTEIEPARPPVSVEAETLKYLGYDPENIATRALVVLALRYQLDPLLGEIALIADSKGKRLYVTRDGMLAVAHRSGHLDGITVDEQRRNSTGDGWTAYVSVWRDDMAHPFRYGAQCKDSEPQARAGNGPEMALARAERRALKRAFQITTDVYPERPDVEVVSEWEPEAADTSSRALGEVGTAPSPPTPAAPAMMNDDQARRLGDLVRALGVDGPENRTAMLALLTEATGRIVERPSTLTEPEADAALYYLASLVDDRESGSEAPEEAF